MALAADEPSACRDLRDGGVFAPADTAATLASVPAKVQLFDGLDRALRRMRKDKGLDQAGLQEASGVARSSISSYENGKEPELGTLGKLLVALGADLCDLQEHLDEINGRPRKRRPAGPVDTATLTKLRLSYPHAPQDLLVERAVVEQEMKDALARADRMQRELDKYERSTVAEPPGEYR